MEQRSQFILVNSTKPLPKGLIHELLPVTPAEDLPLPLLKRRYPAQLLDRLNYDPRLAAAGPDPHADDHDRRDQGQLDSEDARDEHRGRRALRVVRRRAAAPATWSRC